ncbi:MAG: nitroreductase [Anaerotignum sp.]|nr:nitroreductase [Anaerotignum sp.]
MIHADYLSAIQRRCSRRKYTASPIEEEKAEALHKSSASYNETSGLNMKLILGTGGELFDGFKRSYGLFVGVKNYIALIGRADDPDRMEKEGYYGEKLVLEATHMGLSTCWVGTSYDKGACDKLLAPGETLDLVVAIGYTEEKHSLKERFMENNMRKGGKDRDSLCEIAGEAPNWFLHGIDAVAKSPSARNLMPFVFRWQDGKVSAHTTQQAERVMVDLGIAKLHFEIGAGGGRWDWGDGAEFHRE